MERLLKTTPATEISVHDNFSRGALKKVLKDSSLKDMRKAVEAMARRVDKHFIDDDNPGGVGGLGGGGGGHHNPDPATAALVASVWRDLTAELKREIMRATELMAKSYGGTGLSLEYTAGDVEGTCARAKH